MSCYKKLKREIKIFKRNSIFGHVKTSIKILLNVVTPFIGHFTNRMYADFVFSCHCVILKAFLHHCTITMSSPLQRFQNLTLYGHSCILIDGFDPTKGRIYCNVSYIENDFNVYCREPITAIYHY